MTSKSVLGHVVDPVCGIRLSPGSAQANVNYQGQHLYFCTKACQDAFKAAPEKYGFPKRKGFWRRFIEKMEKATAERPISCSRG